MLKEIKTRCRETDIPDIGTVYFGGGTPSLISPGGISAILSAIAENFKLTNPETTIEVNPGTVDLEKLKGYRNAGITRLSIGVQSFNDRLLVNLGRSHSRKDALNTLESAGKAGFDNTGIDLIHSIEGESLQDWEDDLKEAVSLHPEHISAYNLTIEEGTPFHHSQEKGLLYLPQEEEQTEMLLTTIEILCSAGYEHYEVSNYAMPGFRSQHNQIYWNGGDYLGIGVSAHSYIRKGWGIRRANSSNLTEYLNLINNKGTAVVDEEILSKEKAMGEAVFLGLRMMEGIVLNDFESRFGTGIETAFTNAVEELRTEGFLIYDKDNLKLTRKGLLFYNDVAIRFV